MSIHTIPFWESNLNPITMFSPSITSKYKTQYNTIQREGFIKTEDLDGYVTGRSLIIELGVSAKKLKSLFASIGETPRFNKNTAYYNSKNIDNIKEILLQKLVIQTNIELYISNRELMAMFNINQYKAWEIAINEKLVKYKFSRNVNYYEREKAMEAFSKYQKK